MSGRPGEPGISIKGSRGEAGTPGTAVPERGEPGFRVSFRRRCMELQVSSSVLCLTAFILCNCNVSAIPYIISFQIQKQNIRCIS